MIKTVFLVVVVSVVQQNASIISRNEHNVDTTYTDLISNAKNIAQDSENQASMILRFVEMNSKEWAMKAQTAANIFFAQMQRNMNQTNITIEATTLMSLKCAEEVVVTFDSWAINSTISIAGCVTEKAIRGFIIAMELKEITENITTGISDFGNKLNTECSSLILILTPCKLELIITSSVELVLDLFRLAELVFEEMEILTYFLDIKEQLPICICYRGSRAIVHSREIIFPYTTCLLKSYTTYNLLKTHKQLLINSHK